MAALNAWSLRTGWDVQFKVSGFGAPLTFLDVELYWRRAWHSRVYYKPTDVHAYIPWDLG